MNLVKSLVIVQREIRLVLKTLTYTHLVRTAPFIIISRVFQKIRVTRRLVLVRSRTLGSHAELAAQDQFRLNTPFYRKIIGNLRVFTFIYTREVSVIQRIVHLISAISLA